jgi:serine/threonine-protein kinase
VPLAPGDRFGPYRIVAPLGRGGMATVFKAHEAGLDRHVALKILPSEFLHEPAFAERFRREARVIARLEHPHIVPLYAFGIEGDLPWMAMRLIDGGSLAQILKGGRLSLARASAFLRHVAAALDYAHAKGVVHRDVKPQNVLVDTEEHAYLADFGVARIVEGSVALTRSGSISGTPNYMAPELALGQGAGPACDIYALGVMTYEVLTGRVPFRADTPVAVLMKQVSEPVPLPPPGLAPQAPLAATLRCLEKDPARRWPSATAFAEAFEQALAGLPPETVSAPRPAVRLTAATHDSLGSGTMRSLRKAGITPAALALLLGGSAASVAIAATILWLLFGPGRARKPEPVPSPSAAAQVTALEPSPLTEVPTPVAATPSPEPTPSASASASPSPLSGPRPGAVAARRVPALQTPPPAPVASEPAPPTPAAPEPLAAGSLTIDVDAVRDADDATTQVLHLRVEVEGHPALDERLEFTGEGYVERSRARATLQLESVRAGRQQVVVKASVDPRFASRVATGSLRVELRPGPNRLSARVRYLSDTDREVRLR